MGFPIDALRMRSPSAGGGGGGGTPNPDFANVVLLMGFDGTNNSTTMTDESSYINSMSAVGNAKLSTAQFKFGTASLLLDGSGDAVEDSNSTMLDPIGPTFEGGINSAWDLQIEAWVRFAVTNTSQMIVTKYSATGNNITFRLWRSSVGTFLFQYSTDGTFAALVTAVSAAWSASTGTWYHAAYSRVGGVSRLFVDGVKIAESSVSNFTAASVNSPVRIGGIESAGAIANSFNGNIDEVRIAVYQSGDGAGKLYTADFTPPTAAFPRS